MGSDIGGVILAGSGGAVLALLVVALFTLARRRNRTRADLEALLLAAQHEADDLRARLEELTARVTPAPAQVAPAEPAYLITDVGGSRRPAVPEDQQLPVSDRLVLSATVGEPLVKVVAFGHGLRRALSPESRNRIWFEVRREVRAARKRRRQQLKQYQRDVRAAERAQEGLA